MENKQSIWGKVLQILITILTAIATTFGVQSCQARMSEGSSLLSPHY